MYQYVENEEQTQVQYAGEVELLVHAETGDDSEGVVHHERVLLGTRATDGDGVPLVVIETGSSVVPHPDRSVAQVEDVLEVTVHQLHGDEVLLPAGVVEDQPTGLSRLELEVDVGGGVRLEDRQADERVLRLEGDRVMDELVVALAEVGRHVDLWVVVTPYTRTTLLYTTYLLIIVFTRGFPKTFRNTLST